MQLKDLIDKNGHCEIPEGTAAISDFALYHCTQLKSVRIPDSCTRIGRRAFSYCTSLKSVRIPDSVTEIGGWAFSRCTALKSVRIPDSVTKIGDWAFYCCSSLKSVSIPDSCTAIGDWAFYRCTVLPSVELAHHTAIRVDKDLLQISCKCERLGWWESGEGKAFAMANGYTKRQRTEAIEQLRKLCNFKT